MAELKKIANSSYVLPAANGALTIRVREDDNKGKRRVASHLFAHQQRGCCLFHPFSPFFFSKVIRSNGTANGCRCTGQTYDAPTVLFI